MDLGINSASLMQGTHLPQSSPSLFELHVLKSMYCIFETAPVIARSGSHNLVPWVPYPVTLLLPFDSP